MLSESTGTWREGGFREKIGRAFRVEFSVWSMVLLEFFFLRDLKEVTKNHLVPGVVSS